LLAGAVTETCASAGNAAPSTKNIGVILIETNLCQLLGRSKIDNASCLCWSGAKASDVWTFTISAILGGYPRKPQGYRAQKKYTKVLKPANNYCEEFKECPKSQEGGRRELSTDEVTSPRP
jgi:hypothetical protein